MKHLFAIFLLLSSFSLLADKIPEESQVGAPSNPVSQGADESSGISDSPVGTTKKQAEEYRERPSSMGGAPNVGAGMGTGTGAGSKVGNEIEEGTINAGAVSGEEEE